MEARNAALISILVLAFGSSCKKENAAEEAQREADEAAKQPGVPQPIKLSTPVPGDAHVPCEQLIDLAQWQTVLGEPDPLELSDNTATDANAVAVCSINKGGVRWTAKQQEAAAKKTNHKIGVIPGQPICTVTAFCWTVETAENFKARCEGWSKEPRAQVKYDESTMGSPSCLRVVPTGSDDVQSFKFFDEDTKCILNVAGGPANVDNAKIALCAQTARDTIGLDQIRADVALPPVP